MKYKKVKMIIDFLVPAERADYGIRTCNELSWQEYAEHDMLAHLKDYDDMPEQYRQSANRWSSECDDISFKWGKEIEKKDDWCWYEDE